MFDRTEHNPVFLRDKASTAFGQGDPLLRTAGVRAKSAFVHGFGNEPADLWVHAAGFAKKEPVVGWHDRMEGRFIRPAHREVLQSELQTGKARVARMCALNGLLQ